jgi:hypothetical protein
MDQDYNNRFDEDLEAMRQRFWGHSKKLTPGSDVCKDSSDTVIPDQNRLLISRSYGYTRSTQSQEFKAGADQTSLPVHNASSSDYSQAHLPSGLFAEMEIIETLSYSGPVRNENQGAILDRSSEIDCVPFIQLTDPRSDCNECSPLLTLDTNFSTWAESSWGSSLYSSQPFFDPIFEEQLE